MSKLRLTIAVGDYDITRPLIDGAVEPEGIDLTVVHYPSPQRHFRMLVHHDFDACELSLGSFVALRASGNNELVGLPAFPHRRFRHGYVFAANGSDVKEPADFADKTVGVRSWQTTAGVWLRGILSEHYGLDLKRVQWIAQDPEDVELSLPPGLRLSRVQAGDTVTDLCAKGEIAGLIYPELPSQLESGESLHRVFSDPKAVEQEYFKRTSIFPIMHLVVVNSDIAARYPWVTRNLLEAFQESKRLAQERIKDPRTVSLAWLRQFQDEENALLGPDPWRYGFDSVNRTTLETFLRYSLDQGVANTAITPEELFDPSTTDELPKYV